MRSVQHLVQPHTQESHMAHLPLLSITHLSAALLGYRRWICAVFGCLVMFVFSANLQHVTEQTVDYRLGPQCRAIAGR